MGFILGKMELKFIWKIPRIVITCNFLLIRYDDLISWQNKIALNKNAQRLIMCLNSFSSE